MPHVSHWVNILRCTPQAQLCTSWTVFLLYNQTQEMGLMMTFLSFNKDICQAYDESNFPGSMQISKEKLVPETQFTENEIGA